VYSATFSNCGKILKEIFSTNNMSDIKKCYKCSTILNQNNKIKNRNLCKECSNQISKDYKLRNKDKISEYNKIYKENNKTIISEYNKNYNLQNRETIQKRQNKNQQNRRLKDVSFKLAQNCRNKIRKYLCGDLKTFKLIGCSVEFLKDWLIFNFNEKMTLENYGSYWHMDHVIPCSLFDLNNNEEINNCFKWTNIQPLEGKLNIIKNNNINKDEVISHWIKVKEFALLKNITVDYFDYTKYF
jgi:hypothetical protein